MSLLSVLLYSFCIVFFIVYIYVKYKLRKYFFSIFNIGLYIYFFAFLISPVFFYVDESWIALGISKAITMHEYLNKCILINGIAFIVYILSLIYFEFLQRNKNSTIARYERKFSNCISHTIIDLIFIVSCLIWYVIVLMYCGGFPLFNGNRTFFLGTSISPIYLFLNHIIFLITLFYGTKFKNKKYKCFLLVGMVTQLLQGNRGPVLIGLVFPIIVMLLYKNNKFKGKTELQLKREKTKNIKKIFVYIPIILIVGLIIGFYRYASDISSFNWIAEIAYGNNFSDIRDGAFILVGFKHTIDNSYIMGNTYFAALLSFLPSSVLEFRHTWSYGHFVTMGLFGWPDHFGLRGGNGMEGYLNFGLPGVLFVSIIQGLIAGKLEKRFYQYFVVETCDLKGGEIFIWMLLFEIGGFFGVTSNTYDVYVGLLLILAITFFSQNYRIKRVC